MIRYELGLKWTNYPHRLNTGPETSASASFFIQAKCGTKYRTIYENKMDNSSFNRKEDSVSKIIEGSNQAYYGRFSKMSGHECEVKESFRSYLLIKQK